ncbi:ankyrin [Wilcoxina mikolae CBS 423.85]|nr:ankyrin [Wilcoxina mikolae CBS 423.85]
MPIDPFSLALGGITICQVAGQVIQLGIGYIQSARDLPPAVKLLVSEIALLSGVLNSLCSTLQSEKYGTTIHLSPDLLEVPVQECKTQLEELYEFLMKHHGTGSKLKNFGRPLKWPMKEQETREWIARMERYKTAFSLVLQQEELAVSKNISGDIEAIRLTQESVRIEERQARQSETFRSALAWLSPVDPRENHHAARKLQQRGTGKWFTESKDFKHWKSARNSFLWLYGSAGSGKTILSSIVLDRLMGESAGSRPPPNLIYFYCDFRDAEKVKAVNIYGSLLAQLLESKYENNLPGEIADYYNKHKLRSPLEQFSKEQLLKLIPTVGPTKIVVDALDECVESARISVLETLMELEKAGLGHVNVFVTSRPELDIKLLLEQVPKLCINALVNSRDIRLFVTEECERSVRLKKKLKGSTKSEVISTISSEAKGMFRWAKCSLDQIARLRNDKAIKRALKSLPPDLNETYERILEGISEDDKELALRILRWLTCSLRPLKIQEIIEGVALELDDTALDPETFLNDPEDIADICGSLVELDQEAGTVALAHFSVKEFFLSSQRLAGPHPDFYINPVQANFDLAKLCVTYLSFEHFSCGPCAAGDELVRRCEAYALYEYAGLKWPAHAQEHTSMEDDEFLSVMEAFFLDKRMNGNFDAWAQVYEAKGRVFESFNSYLSCDRIGETNRLIYACRLGLYSVAKLLLSKCIDPKLVCTSEVGDEAKDDPKSKACGNALNAACESGNVKVVELILATGVDINAIAGRYELPIIAAITTSHYRGTGDFGVLKYLLEKGADPSRVTPRKTFALYEAVNYHCVEGAKMLLEAGADVGARPGKGILRTTVLELASMGCQEEIFEIARKLGGGKYIDPELAELNLNTEVDGYGLMLAAQSNFFESAQRILEKDGEKIFKDPSLEFMMHHTFMQCAADGYYKFLQQMLAYSGPSISAYTECIKLAASNGHGITLRVLLDIKPADFDEQLLKDLFILASGRNHVGVQDELRRFVSPACINTHGWSVVEVAALSHSKEHQDEALVIFQKLGMNPFPDRILKPAGWRLRFDRNATTTPQLVTEGTSAYLLSSDGPCWITFDHPISPGSTYYFEVTFETERPQMGVGIGSALAEYDVSGPQGIIYRSNGVISSPRGRENVLPKYSKGSVVGCAVDLQSRIAVFTCDGKLVDASCSNVRGMVYGMVHMEPGDRIKANFGQEPFLYDPSAFHSGIGKFVMKPTFIFETGKYKDPREPVFWVPDKKYTG